VHVAVFGSTGFLGKQICSSLESKGWRVSPVVDSESGRSTLDVEDGTWLARLQEVGSLDAIVWAQGRNGSGTVLSTAEQDLEAFMHTNVLLIASTLKSLAERELLGSACRAVVLGSVWQNLARENKFAYLVSKSALTGLVGSIAMDMAATGLSINAVLPGVVDSPMTRSQVSVPALEAFQGQSLGGQLVSGQEVAEVVAFLVSPSSSGINGESIVVDHGWSKVRRVEP
jgi:3-oxoacyl-[acyl-carrier protein] reductase